MDKNDLMVFYTGIIEREEELSAMRADIKEAFSAFAENQMVDAFALREGFKYHKKALKNAEEAKTIELERDKLIELLIGGENA